MSSDVSAVAHGLGIPVLVGFERAAWYTSRAVLLAWLVADAAEGGQGLDYPEAAKILTSTTFVVALTPLLGGGLALATGPYPPMILGGLVCAAGYVALAAGAGVWVPLGLLAVGSGLIKPCAWGALGQALPGPRESLRAAAFVGAYVTVNIAAMVASTASGVLAFPVAFPLAAGLVLVVPLAAGGLWVAARTAPEVPMDGPAIGRAAGTAVAVVALVAPLSVVLGLAGDAQFGGAQLVGLGSSEMALLYGINPVVVVVAGVLLALALGGAQLGELRWPPLVLTGVAMVAASLCVLALLPTAVGAVGVPALAVGAVGLALAEVAVFPVALARIAGDGHWRLGPLLVAVWLAVTGVVGFVPTWLQRAQIPIEWPLVAAAATCGVAGMIVLAAAIAARRFLMPTEATG